MSRPVFQVLNAWHNMCLPAGDAGQFLDLEYDGLEEVLRNTTREQYIEELHWNGLSEVTQNEFRAFIEDGGMDDVDAILDAWKDWHEDDD